MSENMAGNFVIGDGLQQDKQEAQTWPFTTEADLRRFVRAEVHKALDDLAKEIRYGVAFRPASVQPRAYKQAGTCWACLGAGDDMEWCEQDGWWHLIHKSAECRRIAEEKIEMREHKG